MGAALGLYVELHVICVRATWGQLGDCMGTAWRLHGTHLPGPQRFRQCRVVNWCPMQFPGVWRRPHRYPHAALVLPSCLPLWCPHRHTTLRSPLQAPVLHATTPNNHGLGSHRCRAALTYVAMLLLCCPSVRCSYAAPTGLLWRLALLLWLA